ncbi:metallophosphoesterase [Halalkalibacter oceani]|uniref:Metallophosphoesterase family protein n=1 Tax=Halalkalibacter oceani TaxID=1653776 RepID=A0A9X2INQ0_9BACI|nr:metallophosphoesterase [Halalkalibacter oceani]MCM3713632.1 metallophosphoesterase family protein [Halalkalibacter oceani]
MNIFIYLMVAAGAVLVFYMITEAFRTRVRHHQLSFGQLPAAFDGFRLFFISDIHRRRLPDPLIETIRGNVDLVIIGGDLCEKGVPLARIEDNLRRLASLGPCVFVWGNNDEEVGAQQLRRLLARHHVIELVNSCKVITRGADQLFIGGVDDIGHKRDDLSQVNAQSEEGFAVLVSHYPDIVDVLPHDHPFSLILSGHTHGGQIRIFGWGLEEKGQMKHRPGYVHLISNGFGTSTLPLRLAAPAETHLIQLRRAK